MDLLKYDSINEAITL